MSKNFLIIIIITSIFSNLNNTKAQNIYTHISSSEIYNFIDELANDGIIEINSCIKPYSRKFISSKLNEAYSKKNLLTQQQKKELNFFLKDYNKELLYKGEYRKRTDLFYYKDSLFNLTINPIGGYQFWSSFSQKKDIYHRWEGAELQSYIGKYFAIYANLRDNYEKIPLAKNTFLTNWQGGKYKSGTASGGKEGGVDYSEMRGGISVGWKWGSIDLIKDHIEWGNNYNGANIFSGHSPSFPLVKLNIKPVSWAELNYFHASLISEVVIDTNGFYKYEYGKRDCFIPKYLAANIITFSPVKRLNISLGNSIIYDKYIQIAYFIPIMFYKSIDHTVASLSNNIGGNAQMFFDISSRNIKHTHLYATMFIDEVHLSNITIPSKQTNFFSKKIGVKTNNLFIPNLTFCFEYTRTNPITYKHFLPTTTFESNQYNLGYYLRDNSESIYFMTSYKPLSKALIKFEYTFNKKGPDYDYNGVQSNSPVKGLPFMKETIWSQKIFSVKTQYNLLNDFIIYCQYIISNVTGNASNQKKYTPSLFYNNNNIISLGIYTQF